MTATDAIDASGNALCVQVGDVVQLSPSHKWGPVLCFVTGVHDWGIECFAPAPSGFADRWLRASLRIEHHEYLPIGKAQWMPS